MLALLTRCREISEVLFFGPSRSPSRDVIVSEQHSITLSVSRTRCVVSTASASVSAAAAAAIAAVVVAVSCPHLASSSVASRRKGTCRTTEATL